MASSTFVVWVAVGTAYGISLFWVGFYWGIRMTRTLRETVVHEVPKIVTTERVVEIEKPVLVQPNMTINKPTNGGSGPALPVMRGHSVIADPTERAQLEHMQELMSTEPEA